MPAGTYYVRVRALTAAQFRGGKEGVIGFLVGQLMKKSKGAANPQEAQRLLRQRLVS